MNLTLVREGDAREFVFDENDTYRAEFEAAEAAARQEDAGMWGACDAVDR